MALFGIGKKKEKEEKSCCCDGSFKAEQMAQAEKQKSEGGIKILGSGCKKCNELETATKAAISELDMDIAIDHVTDFSEIASYGVMSTPALVVNGKVVSYGKVLKKEEVITLLKKEIG